MSAGPGFIQRSFISIFLASALVSSSFGLASTQKPPSANRATKAAFVYSVKFLCGPSSEAFQEGMVSGFAATAVNILNPSSNSNAQFTKRVSRALPYQAPGPVSQSKEGLLDPLQAIEIECNEIRQMLPSQMTKEFRTGFLIIRSNAPLEVTAIYSARPRDGEISTLDVQRIEGRGVADEEPPTQQSDLTVTELHMEQLENRCPQGPGSCVARVPVMIANIGAADAGPFRLRVTFDPNQSVVVTYDLPMLAAGASQTIQVETPPGGNCFDPNCRICAVVDSEAVVAESNENNNELCRERQG